MELEGFQTMHPLCALDLGLGALFGVSDVSAEKDLMEHLGVKSSGTKQSELFRAGIWVICSTYVQAPQTNLARCKS